MKTNIFFVIMLIPMFMGYMDNSVSGDSLDTEMVLWIRDKSGKNLLDPSINGHYNLSQIKMFYLINGNRKEVYSTYQVHIA